MQKWDYLHIWLEHQQVTMVNGKKLEKVNAESDMRVKGDNLSELLTQAGEDGWELVSHKMPNVGTEVFVFKRPRSL
jgi:hypothetical protein